MLRLVQNVYLSRSNKKWDAPIAEFPESQYTQSIIDRLLMWRFTEFIPTQNIWQFYPFPIQNGARLALRQTDRIAAISGLERFIRTVENPFLKWQAAYSLGKVFDPGNSIAIHSLVGSIATVYNDDTCIKICESVCKIDPNYNSVAIAKLIEIIETSKAVNLVHKAAFIIGKLAIVPFANLEKKRLPVQKDSTDNRSIATTQDLKLFNLAIDTLVAIVESPPNPAIRLAAIENLRQISPTHPAASSNSIATKQTLPSSTHNRFKKVTRQRRNDLAISVLESKLLTTDNPENQRRYAYQLGKFQLGHPLAVNILLKLLVSTRPPSFYKRTGEYLIEILLDEQLPLVVGTLKVQAAEIERGDRSALALQCYKLIWYCTERLPYQKFCQIWKE